MRLSVFCLALAALIVIAFAPRDEAQQRAAAARPIASDLAQRLAKFRPVKMPFDEARLSVNEIRMLSELVLASQYLENIFWRQSDPEGLELYKSLYGRRDSRDQHLLRLLMIHGSRFDLVAENEPFTGEEKMSPGHGLYPKGLTREEVERYVLQHPEKKDEIYSGYTVVRRTADGALEGIPYHVAYRELLEPAAQALRQAAALSDDKPFAEFLRLRAGALLTDDYYESDLAWLDLKDPKFDVIFAPYETYLDDLMGVKTSYGAAVLIRDEAESRKLAMFQKYVPGIQDALPLPAADRPSKHGQLTPMEVMDAPFRAGDLRHGYQAVADNLPNDPRIHQEKGTKKIFFKNFMDARVNFIILPIAQRLMEPGQARKVSREGYMAGTLMHEIAHGLGPPFARTAKGQVDIREAIGPVFSALEEAKADIVGLFGLKYLAAKGVVPKARLEEAYTSQLAGLFRTVRFSVAEAHGLAELMEFNYFYEQGAIRRNEATGRYEVDYAKFGAAIDSLAKELLEIEATGDRARAERWFAKYQAVPEHLKSALAKVEHVPVDIDPVFSFPEPIQ